jgi:hypothetical protein
MREVCRLKLPRDAWLGLVWLVFGIGFFLVVPSQAAQKMPWEVVGAKFLPQVAAAATAFLGALLTARHLIPQVFRRARRLAEKKPISEPTETIVIRRVILICIAFAAYAGLIFTLGFYTSSVLVLVAMIVAWGGVFEKGRLRIQSLKVGVTIVILLAFCYLLTAILRTPMPSGLLI